MTPELFLSCGGELRDVEEEFSEYVRYCYGHLSEFSFFSLSPCPFSQSSFQIDPNSNAYLLAKIGVDTAENEPLEVWGENSIQYSLHSLAASCTPRSAQKVDQRHYKNHEVSPLHKHTHTHTHFSSLSRSCYHSNALGDVH